MIYSKRKVLKSLITELRTAVKNLTIINYNKTEDDSQIPTESSESDSE